MNLSVDMMSSLLWYPYQNQFHVLYKFKDKVSTHKTMFKHGFTNIETHHSIPNSRYSARGIPSGTHKDNTIEVNP